jgi:EAL domain-containing protein (putative c-di-GMP-specific phosphodiesterase class I)/ActR/RegA family two-component response regulator
MDAIRVLIADDDPGVIDVLTEVIASDPSMDIVGTAGGADEAIDLAKEHHPDVALLDVRMPGGGGPRAARGIRRGSPQTDVIALSASEEPDTVMTMLDSGASGYVSKADSTLEILRAIRRCRQGKPALSIRVRDGVAETLADRVAGTAAKSTRTHALRERILRFIDGEDLDVVFQPIVELTTGAVVAVESLARFTTRPRRGPEVWFREARAHGLSVQLEMAAVRKALAKLPSLPPSVCLSVNFSPEAIESEEFPVVLGRQPLDRLIVEVTEQSAPRDHASLEESLRAWRWAGLLLAIDDAGAGFSTLNRIVELRPEFIKLDITLTRHIETDIARQSLVEMLQVHSAHVGASLVAEGVETDGQIARLLELGVGLGQGNRLGRPGPLPTWNSSGPVRWEGRHAFGAREARSRDLPPVGAQAARRSSP